MNAYVKSQVPLLCISLKFQVTWKPVSVIRRLWTADCRLWTRGKMQTVCKMQTADWEYNAGWGKMQTEYKLYLWKGLRAKNPANTCKQSLEGNHSNNKERCSAGNLDDLLWKYCKSRYADLSCSDAHWNFWWMCNVLRLGSEVCNWYQLAISPIWRRRSTNV